MTFFKQLAVTLTLIAAASVSHAASIVGSITSSDFYTTDSTGKTFYTDYFDIMVGTTTSLNLKYDAMGDLKPYLLLIGNTSPTPLLPASDWESPLDLYSTGTTASSLTSGDMLSLGFTALAGTLYQVGLTSSSYVEDSALTSFGNYTFTVEDDQGATPDDLVLRARTASVPVPATLSLMLLGLLGLSRRLAA